MSDNRPEEKGDRFERALSQWRVSSPLPPRFQEAVWRRIERAERVASPSVWAVIAHWIGTMLPRPALAASYIALLLAIGVTAGWAQARQETERVKSELGERYVRVLDPYQTPRQ